MFQNAQNIFNKYVFVEKAKRVRREKKATLVLRVLTCRGLKERKGPAVSQDSRVLKGSQDHRVYQAGTE